MTKTEVFYEAEAPEAIEYKRGTVFVMLNGFNAWLYRAMINQYGNARATEKFWWLWHKKEGSAFPTNAERNETI